MKRTGPDSLSSWIIALGCCFINMMMFGMARLSGVLFVASVPRFHVTREQASFPYTLSQAVRNTSGPLVGYLGQKFGVRLVTTIGCVVAAVGIGTCFLAEDIATITVLWGCIFGLGFGLGNILLPISINQYFDKKRATASGISFSGACIGSFAIPPIVEFLINLYGLSGTFLILSGFVLNCLPAALLLRKPKFTIRPHKYGLEPNREKQSITNGKKIKLYTTEVSSQVTNILAEKFSYKFESSVQNNSKEYQLPREVVNKSYIESCKENIQRHSTGCRTPNALDFGTTLDINEMSKDHKSSVFHTNERPFPFSRRFSSISNQPLNKDGIDSMHSKSYDNLYSNLAYQADFDDNFQTFRKETYSATPSFTVSMSAASEKEEGNSIIESFSIINDPVFIIIALTNALYSSMFVCMITVIVDFARDVNVGETNEKFIIMSLSVGDLIGRVSLGWVTDEGYMTRSNFAALCFFCQGVTMTVVAWSSGFTMLMIMSALYGLSESGLILIFPLLIAEFIEEEKQTVAIPSSYFLSGPLCLAVAPLIGFFRDEIGSYEFLFYGMGIISLVCTFCWLLAPCMARCRKSR